MNLYFHLFLNFVLLNVYNILKKYVWLKKLPYKETKFSDNFVKYLCKSKVIFKSALAAYVKILDET
jgi:hypothetical protein